MNQLQITQVDPASLEAYENNPRHNDKAVPQMVELIEAYGFKVPVLVRGNRIVDGHLRVKAALKMGLAEVPAIDIGDMDEAHERALRIAINKSVSLADWDMDALKIEMEALKLADFDLSLTAFGDKEIKKLMAETSAKVTKTKDANAGTVDPSHVSLTTHHHADTRKKITDRLKVVMEANDLENMSQALAYLVLTRSYDLECPSCNHSFEVELV